MALARPPTTLGTSSVNVAGPRPARSRTASMSAGVAAVLWATTRTRLGSMQAVFHADGPRAGPGLRGQPFAAASLGPHLGEDAFEPRLRLVVDVGHRGGDGGVDVGDQPVHLVGDRAIRRMPLAPGAQLDELHRLARVEVEHVAQAVAEAQGVRRLALAPLAGEPLPRRARRLERAAVV